MMTSLIRYAIFQISSCPVFLVRLVTPRSKPNTIKNVSKLDMPRIKPVILNLVDILTTQSVSFFNKYPRHFDEDNIF